MQSNSEEGGREEEREGRKERKMEGKKINFVLNCGGNEIKLIQETDLTGLDERLDTEVKEMSRISLWVCAIGLMV